MSSPYSDFPARQFWSRGVAPVDIATVTDVYRPRFSIEGMKVATAGSCFAQHIALNLRKNGYAVIDKEPPPPGLRGPEAQAFGYQLYSARHGNIYTVRRLLQLTQEALGLYAPGDVVWATGGRYYDSLRPGVEPDGLPSAEEVLAQRADHVARFKAVLLEADLFVFTMGLTEAWVNAEGLVYAGTPGSPAGTFDPQVHLFKNFRFNEIYDDFVAFRDLVRSINPGIRFLVTVSPVPLTATAVDSHVLPATVRSKSVLRAVAAQLYEDFDDIDYFPSYDLLSTPFLGPSKFEVNKRSVSAAGVAAAMRTFLDAHMGVDRVAQPKAATKSVRSRGDDLVCEEALLDAFAPKT